MPRHFLYIFCPENNVFSHERSRLKKILMDIASGTQSLNPFPNCFKNIVERLDKRKIKSTCACTLVQRICLDFHSHVIYYPTFILPTHVPDERYIA